MEEEFEVLYPDESGFCILSMTRREIRNRLSEPDKNGVNRWFFADGQKIDSEQIMGTPLRGRILRMPGGLVGGFCPQVKVRTLLTNGRWNVSDEIVSNILGEEYFVYIDGVYVPSSTELREEDAESWQDVRRYRRIQEWTY